MFKEIIVLVLAAVGCHADALATSQVVVCGKIPEKIFSCSQIPSLFGLTNAMQCDLVATPNGKLTCQLTEAGCMKDGKVDKQKAKEFFDEYAVRNPEFAAAANHAKAACVGDKDLPAQGIHLNCPAFDVLHCTLTSFLRNVPASKWVKSAECEELRQYAQSCPICPDDCFATKVPNGSCHACQAVPRPA